MKRILQPFREFGVLPGLIYLADRAAERISRRRFLYYYAIVVQPVVGPRLRPSDKHESFACTTWEAIAPYAGQMPPGEALIRARLDEGYVCIILAKDGLLLAYAWVSLGPYLEDEVRCRFVPLPDGRTAWDFDVFIPPRMRGTLVFVRLWDAVNAFLTANGRLWSVSRISRFNTGSYQSHLGMGALPCCRILFIRFGTLQLLISPMKPFVHLSLSRRSVPVQEFDVSSCVADQNSA